MEPPKRLITRILEFSIMLTLSAFLINTAACWILEVWPILLVIVLVIAAIVIIYRVWRHRHDLGQW